MLNAQDTVKDKVKNYLVQAADILSKLNWEVDEDVEGNLSQLEVAKMLQIEAHRYGGW